jgi:hypothetical protein
MISDSGAEIQSQPRAINAIAAIVVRVIEV